MQKAKFNVFDVWKNLVSEVRKKSMPDNRIFPIDSISH